MRDDSRYVLEANDSPTCEDFFKRRKVHLARGRSGGSVTKNSMPGLAETNPPAALPSRASPP